MYSEQRAILAQRQQQVRAYPAALDDCSGDRVVELPQIGNVDEALAGKQRCETRVFRNGNAAPHPLRRASRIALRGGGAEYFAVE